MHKLVAIILSCKLIYLTVDLSDQYIKILNASVLVWVRILKSILDHKYYVLRNGYTCFKIIFDLQQL